MDLHREKPSTQVHYNKQMPEIDTLMEQWSDGFEQRLDEVKYFYTADYTTFR